MKKRKKLLRLLLLWITLFMATTQGIRAKIRFSSSQVEQIQFRTITGTVKTQSEEAIVGATVASENGDEYSTTDLDGKFTITIKKSSKKFNVVCLGYKSVTFSVTDAENYNIVLEEESMMLEETVVVGYGIQKKASVTGSIASIGSEEIVKTKNSNVLNMLTGRVPGLRVVQKTSQPGNYKMQWDIRGFGSPLIIVDGIPRSMDNLEPNEIESISILKDAAAAVYGVKAANGVVLVTTKSGKSGEKINISYNGNMIWQVTSGLPKIVGAVDYMKMLNERSNCNVNGGGTLTYSPDEIAAYESGEKKSTDWNKELINKFAPQTQNNVSISGGNQKINFFTNIGHQYQQGFFKYRSFNYNRLNLRTKVNAQLTSGLTFDINLNGIFDKTNRPSMAVNNIIFEWWKSLPFDPVYANDTEPYYNFVMTDTGINPVAILNTDVSGYQHYKHEWFQSSAALTWKFPWIKGLEAKALFSYDYDIGNNTSYNKSYKLYRYDEIEQKYNSVLKNTPSTILRGFTENKKSMYQLSLRYDNTFKNAHHVNALLLLENSRGKSDNFHAKRELSLNIEYLFAGNAENQEGNMNMNDLYENLSMGLIGRFNYDYKGKYLTEFIFRYDGSSRFDKKHRWGFFPSGSIGYRMSEEDFWKNSPLKFINNFKVRASYGVMGHDAALDYQFLAGYAYPSGDFSFFDGKLVNGVKNRGIPNPNITWFTAHTMNIGFDLEAWEGKLGIAFDWFQRLRYGLLATRVLTIPGMVGATFPQENLNSDRQFGYELEISHKNFVNKELYYTIKGNVSMTRGRHLHVESQEYRSYKQNWKQNQNDRFKSMYWGIEAGGQYQNFDEIAEFPVKTDRTTVPGDYYYQDWNGDGFIDANDEHPIGYTLGNIPLLYYGMTLDIGFYGFDFNMLFQGTAMSNIAFKEGALYEPLYGGHPPLSFWKDRWRPAVEGSDPYKYNTEWVKGKYPSIGNGKKTIVNSEFNVHNNAYLRLKNVELGYTLPKRWLEKVRIDTLRIYLNCYNILTFSSLKLVDPEHPNDNNGYMYPLNKTVTIGLNLKF